LLELKATGRSATVALVGEPVINPVAVSKLRPAGRPEPAVISELPTYETLLEKTSPTFPVKVLVVIEGGAGMSSISRGCN
jgi:hypothetical protein